MFKPFTTFVYQLAPMRKLFIALLLLVSAVTEAQSVLPAASNKFQTANQAVTQKNSVKPKNWFITKCAGINSGFSFFKGGNAFITSLPVGVQLNRRITDNVYAFAGVQVAPSYISFNQSFLNSGINKYTGMAAFNPNQLMIPAKAELGLMYMNDQKTFSISGSFSVQKSNYPLLPYYQPSVFGGPYFRR